MSYESRVAMANVFAFAVGAGLLTVEFGAWVGLGVALLVYAHKAVDVL
jgi:hypothetical protein